MISIPERRRFRLDLLWADLEKILAEDFPHLWSIQLHVAGAAAAVGVLISAGLGLFLSVLPTGELSLFTPILLSIVGQFGALAIWAFRVSQVPRPDNVLQYKNSPLLSIIVLVSAGIFAGPAALALAYADHLPKQPSELLPLAISELLFLGTAMRLAGLFKGSASSLKAGVGPASAAFLASLLLLGVVAFLGLSAFVIGIAVVIVAGFRMVVCFRAGWRSSMNIFWLNIATMFPPIYVGFLAVRSDFLKVPFLVSAGFGSKVAEIDQAWPVYLGALVAATLWLDGALWFQARLAILPRRER